jgi:hypothetical protein
MRCRGTRSTGSRNNTSTTWSRGREVRLKPTILTTNERGQDIGVVLGDALTSRATGWGPVVDFGTSDYRALRRMRQRVVLGSNA